jgi:MFS family permease
VNRRLLFALLAMAVAQAAVYIVRPMTSYRLLGLGWGAGAVGVVAAAFALLPLFLAIPLGRHADRRHGASLLVIGCAVQCGACFLLAAARSPWTLGGASAILGLGHLALALGVQAVVARESDDERHDQHFVLLTAGVSLGQLFGPLIGGALLGDRTGAALVPATTRAMLVAGGIAAIAFLCALAAERGHEAAPIDVPPDTDEGTLRQIMLTPGVPAGIFASIAVLSASDVFTAYLPVLGEQRAIGPAVIGVLLALRAGFSLVSRIGIVTLVRRVGRVRLITLSAVGAAAALGGMTFTGDVILLGVLCALVGAGLGFGQPLSMTIVVQLVPDHARATALAIRLTGNRVGQVAAPATAGLIAGNAGANAVFWMLGALLVASAAAIQRPAVRSRLAPRSP